MVVAKDAIDTLLLTRMKTTSLRVWRCFLKEVSDVKGLSPLLLVNLVPSFPGSLILPTPAEGRQDERAVGTRLAAGMFKRQFVQVTLKASYWNL